MLCGEIMGLRRLLHWLFLLPLLAFFLGSVSVARAQGPTPSPGVLQLLNSMTPEERVGQLFLVTFRGTDTSQESQIYDLIVNFHVGGVVLLAGNDNFVTAPQTVIGTHKLVGDLQNIEWTATASPMLDTAGQPVRQAYIPLLVGIAQEGGGPPHDQILSGITPLPDEMAIGATWNTDLAYQVGEALGKELFALGFNLYLGPLLDVLDAPKPAASSDLGTRVFGGDPYWVGKMGSAYVKGLHGGSDGHLLVIAKHFPGRGGSDRLPEQEIATVRKSLEQLKQIELAPFFAVTGNAPDLQGTVDGLLVSHIRYQGFQGNIRATTRPVSFDAAALSQILALPQFASWRQSGGLMVSDDLGSQAVRQFYAQGAENFSARLVARDAFLACNDLLYLGNILSRDAQDTYAATAQVLEFFAQEYRSDPAFAQLVDTAVVRILTQKSHLYSTFTISNVITPEKGLEVIGSSQQPSFDVARSAATLISPDPQELSALLPTPPQLRDHIVFLTDTAFVRQCSSCSLEPTLPAAALEQVVVRLYGPNGSGQVFPSRLSSYPFDEVKLMLDGLSKSALESDLSRATWVILSLADVGTGQLDLLRRFFSERPDLIQSKNVILFSFTAPYYLDATDISKLTAYYALYSKQPAFLDVAARLLYQQIPLQGASPVSIPAIGYELIAVTSPNPNQVIPLLLDEPIQQPAPTAEESSTTAEPTQIPLFRIGDTIAVRAGPILDHNRHPVPDGTVVRFTLTLRDESGSILQQVESVTGDGIARTSFKLEKPGTVEISSVSEPAKVSEVLRLDASNEGAAVTVVVPIVTPTALPPLPTTTVVVESDLVSPEGYPRVGLWLLVFVALAGGAGLTFWAVTHIINLHWAVRWMLCVLIGGLLAYNYLALGLPGAADWVATEGGPFGVLLFTFAGELVGLIAAFIWRQWFSASGSRAG